MPSPRHTYTCVELVSGPISFRIGEDALELDVGSSASEMSLHLDLSVAACTTVHSVLGFALPIIRRNKALIGEGRLSEVFTTAVEEWVEMGSLVVPGRVAADFREESPDQDPSAAREPTPPHERCSWGGVVRGRSVRRG
ncbi:hypothetical protein L6E12_10630 [Actinokineospora sp. PR83]|uniref:hypothetical protein n=1 Tax=Actinokineospora sp. PR83 TaxID=2884908 RepID=UPI001F492AD2|nr:hypothetical protein [Actinokineospora sp. PR83]MCG8916244.1 hypothetical protein [Actinokineospora sp. PR83]